MQNTSNYNFNLPEGTDLWNYLTQTNPNFTALDTILKGISDATVTTATEVTSGTAHAVTRTLPDANVIRFTATGVWTVGDSMTIDGTPVTVVKPNGTSLQTGDYIIGSEVLGILRATQFTVYVGGGSSTVDAEDVDYDNTVSGLIATDVQAAIDEEAAAIATNTSDISTINNNISSLGYKEIATASANQTFAQQLAYLKPYYDNLSPAEKYSSMLIRGNGKAYQYQGNDEYSYYNASTTSLSVDTMNISAYTFQGVTVINSSTINKDDVSNYNNAETIKLVVVR